MKMSEEALKAFAELTTGKMLVALMNGVPAVRKALDATPYEPRAVAVALMEAELAAQMRILSNIPGLKIEPREVTTHAEDHDGGGAEGVR